jgi:hypothetical protein
MGKGPHLANVGVCQLVAALCGNELVRIKQRRVRGGVLQKVPERAPLFPCLLASRRSAALFSKSWGALSRDLHIRIGAAFRGVSVQVRAARSTRHATLPHSSRTHTYSDCPEGSSGNLWVVRQYDGGTVAVLECHHAHHCLSAGAHAQRQPITPSWPSRRVKLGRMRASSRTAYRYTAQRDSRRRKPATSQLT